jgi:hypothetical protein
VGLGAAALPAAPPAIGGWPPVAGPFCATANEAPPTSSAPTTIRFSRVVIEFSNAKTAPRMATKKPLAHVTPAIVGGLGRI